LVATKVVGQTVEQRRARVAARLSPSDDDRAELLAMIAAHGDAARVGGSGTVLGAEAIVALGLQGDGMALGSAYARLWALETAGLLASVPTPGGAYRRWPATAVRALIDRARREHVQRDGDES
jgi:hypothetical protein